MNSRMLSRAIVATALVGAIAVPSAMACGGGKGPSGPPGGVAYKQPSKSPSYDYTGKRFHRGDRDRDRYRGDRGERGDCTPAPPPATPPVDPPPVDPPPTGPAL